MPLRHPEWPPWKPPPDGGYSGPLATRTNPRHLSVLARRSPRLMVVDWGCGRGDYRIPIRDVLGHHYVGVDAEGPGADVRADLHRLPFRAASVDHVITNAVLEHVAEPVVAVREVERILRSGGIFSGSAAFLEPHHHRSYFHPTADGLVHVLTAAGLRVEALWPQESWTVFESLAEMPGPVSGPTRWVLRRLSGFERWMRMRWLHPRDLWAGRWLHRRQPEERHAALLTIAGQIDFVAVKP